MPSPDENARPSLLRASGGTLDSTQPSGNASRSIQAAPFCWQHKAALRKIREAFDHEKTVASALGTYTALTEIGSDEQSENFQTTHAHIAQKSGLSPRTVQDRLTGLAEIGLVKISTPALKSPSTYRLMSVPQPLPNDTQPLPNVRQRTNQATLPTVEESSEESLEESSEDAGRSAVASPASRAGNKIADNWLQELATDPAYAGIDVQRELAKMQRWCVEHRKQPTRRRFINWLNRVDRPLPARIAQNHQGGF